MTTPDTPLLTYLDEVYALLRSLSEKTVGHMRAAVRTMDAWHGRPVTLRDLSDEFMSSWARDEQQTKKLAPRSLHGKMNDILAIWRFAYQRGLLDQRPQDVQRPKVPRKNPVAWTEEQLARFFKAAKETSGFLPNGVPRGLYFSTLLRAAYETGLRRADLFLLRTDAVSDDGVVCVTMSKTGLVHIAQMRHETVLGFRKIQALLEFHESDYREFPLHWPLSWAELYPILARIRKVAGVPPGALQQLRRSGATACEVGQPGAAMAYLGHTTPDMAAKHYIDRRQLKKAYMPPEVSQ